MKTLSAFSRGDATIRMIATSDAHLPIGEAELVRAVESNCKGYQPDLLILAGDMVERGRIEFYSRAWEILRKCSPLNIIGVFGNDEYEQLRDKIREENKWASWLNDSTVEISINRQNLLIFGSTGILDVPTKWQRKMIPDIEKRYEERLKKFEEFLKTDFSGMKIAIFHYPPTYKTLHGEPSYAWPEMGSLKAEELIKKLGGVDIIIHGHAHRGKILETKIGNTLVFNVALPARKSLLVYETRKQTKTLLDFQVTEK